MVIALFRNYVMPRQNAVRDTFLPEYVSRSAFLPLFSNTTVCHDGRISQAGCLLEMGGHREKNATDREKTCVDDVTSFSFSLYDVISLQTTNIRQRRTWQMFHVPNSDFLRLSPIFQCHIY